MTCGSAPSATMKLAKSVSESTTTVPPPVNRLITGMPLRCAASTCSICSGLPEMPSTSASAAGCALSHSLVMNQLRRSVRNRASSSCSMRRMGTLRSCSQSARGLASRALAMADGTQDGKQRTPFERK